MELVARTHANFHLTLVGKPFDITMDFLASHTREKNLSDKVTISGPRYYEEKTGLLEDADIFILPTYYDNEAFPLSVLEAMKFGLPVISTFEGGIPDIIDDGADGLLFPKKDIRALAEKIIFLLDHPEERIRLGNAARKKFAERFTVSIFERNMLQVFNQVSGPES
jgi:glycosyltransferase involved in cell wall biosynthesis